ncbi:VWA domain-containing protein [Streptomyces sp. NPDC006477]|uniref:VWA domain-containing protein n=1 Tax=Streptomyces sp. NPDC006477 TaxID=3364747 RepID=UPI00367B360E
MGIRSMLRKVFGRDREETPATSVPPQTRETPTPDTPDASGAPDDAARRAADDLVAASFDNPQIPRARAKTPSAGTTGTVAATGTAGAGTDASAGTAEESAEPVAAKEPAATAEEPEAAKESVATAEAEEPEEPAATAEEPEESVATADEREAVEAEAAKESVAAADEPEAVEAEAADEAAASDAEPSEDETDAPAAEAAAEQAETAEQADPEAADEAEAEAPEAEADEPAEPEADAAVEPQAEVTEAAEPQAEADEPEAEADAEAPADEPAEPETDTTDEPQAEADEAAEPEADAAVEPQADALVADGPALALAKVKAAAPHLADAYKAAGAQLKKQGLTGARAAVYLVVDRSGSMRGYFKDGSVQRLAEQVTALAAHLDEDATVTTVFFSTDIDGTVDLTPADLTPTRVEEINGTLGRLGRTNYHRAVEEVLAHHAKADPARPALVVFQTDGAPESKTAATQALAEAAGRPLHWRFVAWGEEDNKAFDFLRKLEGPDGAPRTATYFPGATPVETPHPAFYRGLLADLEF